MSLFVQSIINGLNQGAVYALVALGYSASEAMMAIRDSGVAASDDTEAILKKALKKIR